MAGFCPHCGFNLTADEPLTIGEWVIEPDGAYRNGEWQRLTPTEASILHSLARANGRVVSHDALVLRKGSDARVSNWFCGAHISRLKKRFPGIPIEAVYGRGYRWIT